VSRAAQQLLKLMADKPILVLKDINHRLFGLIEELSIVQVKKTHPHSSLKFNKKMYFRDYVKI
jgi:hypothetical protein